MESSLSYAYVREVVLRRERIPSFDAYPFCLPAVRCLDSLKLHPRVTYLIGENGTGKSTLLEAIAVEAGFNPEGGSRGARFATHNTHSGLAQCVRLVRGISRPRDGFFLRAESFYNVATYLDVELERQYNAAYGGRSLHEQSHGEAFMALVTNRFRGQGFYILDEPEAALSPARQMALLSVLHELVRKGSQFLIATHSPIVMAYPDSVIYQLEREEIRTVAYKETEHYRISRDFLTHTDSALRELLGELPFE